MWRTKQGLRGVGSEQSWLQTGKLRTELGTERVKNRTRQSRRNKKEVKGKGANLKEEGKGGREGSRRSLISKCFLLL